MLRVIPGQTKTISDLNLRGIVTSAEAADQSLETMRAPGSSAPA